MTWEALGVITALGGNAILLVYLFAKLEAKVDNLDRRLTALETRLAAVEVRLSVLEQRLADFMQQVREWRKDEDDRLGNHKSRLERLEAWAKGGPFVAVE